MLESLLEVRVVQRNKPQRIFMVRPQKSLFTQIQTPCVLRLSEIQPQGKNSFSISLFAIPLTATKTETLKAHQRRALSLDPHLTEVQFPPRSRVRSCCAPSSHPTPEKRLSFFSGEERGLISRSVASTDFCSLAIAA